MKHIILEKAGLHKYIKRLGSKGKYSYVYSEPANRQQLVDISEDVSDYKETPRLIRLGKNRGPIERASEQRKMLTSSAPRNVTPEIKNDVNKELFLISKQHYDEIPLDEIFDSFRKRGMEILQEDFTPFSGLLIGASAEANFEVAPMGSFKDGMCVPFKNAVLRLGWYKMQSGRYEITAYFS